MREKFLTEERLYRYLKRECELKIERNKRIKVAGRVVIPDIYIPDLDTVVEFDGPLHYTKAKVILNDKSKSSLLREYGMRVIRVPYFVQWRSELFYHITTIKNKEIKQTYPHGFISPKAPLPADFCYLGLLRFLDDLETFRFAREDIILSLRKKMEEMHPEEVIPNIPWFVEKLGIT